MNPVGLIRYWKLGLGAVLVLAIVIQTWRLNSALDWQDRAIVATSTAADIRKKDGTPGRLTKSATLKQIAIFGQFLKDVPAARAKAAALDRANVARVKADQDTITKGTLDAYAKDKAALAVRVAALREQLRLRPKGGDHSRSGGEAPVPGLPDSPGGADGASGEDGLPLADAVLATEQALQLLHLQNWLVEQSKVDPNGEPQP